MRRTIIAFTLMAAPAVFPPMAPHAATQARPELPADADPNDWESYFALGERLFTVFPSRAEEAFMWSERLDPTRAEPIMARWAAFYARDQGLWINYLNNDERTLRRPDVILNEERMRLALARNPFVHRGFEAALLSMLGRRILWDRSTEAFLAYGRGNFRRAAADFGALVRRNPRRNYRLRHYRALSLIGANQPDSAAVELERLLADLRRADAEEAGGEYQSKALWEHALGRVHEVRGDTARARRDYERALEEDLAWYPARMGLARLDARAGNADGAVGHLAAAAEMVPNDGVVRLEYGNALALAGRVDDALQQYGRAKELHPHWAEVYLRLGRAHEIRGTTAEAIEAYRGYLARAPRRQAEIAEAVRQRVAELEPTP